MDLHLTGKRALVTGASRGLGYATALGLAQEGCQVVINSRNPGSLLKAAETITQQTGTAVDAIAGNLADPAFPEQLVQDAVECLGGLDLLVTNTGGPPAGKFVDFDDAAWQQAVELTLLSHVRLIRAALPHLRHSPAASVLTITSYSVKQPIANLVLSNSVRAATVGLTKSLALELGTERVIELMSHRARMNNSTVDEEIERQCKDSPLGRMAQPVEFAYAAVFLLSPAASYITGVMLTVDGGMYKGTL
jgi:3-oxoacyl-[acyl-carrier protein] reductase